MTLRAGEAERGGEAREEGGVPWVETPAGGLFFLNAVLVGPALLVLLPVVFRAVLRASGLLEGSSELLDPIPAVAAHVAPWVGWLAVVPIATTLHNLTMVRRRWARAWLVVFLGVHLTVLAWTVRWWLLR